VYELQAAAPWRSVHQHLHACPTCSGALVGNGQREGVPGSGDEHVRVHNQSRPEEASGRSHAPFEAGGCGRHRPLVGEAHSTSRAHDTAWHGGDTDQPELVGWILLGRREGLHQN
jgi:hypothetical protein